MWSKSNSLHLSKAVTVLFFLLLIAGTILLPQILQNYIRYTLKDQVIYVPLLLTLYATVPPAAGLLICLYRLLHNISRGKVFTVVNIKMLRIISWCCFVAGVIFGVFCYQYLMALLIAVAVIFMGLIIRVIKNVFEQALEIKNENDFTI